MVKGTEQEAADQSLEEVLEASVLPRRAARIEQVLAARTRQLVVVVENLHDSHNLSAVLRSAEGFGVQEIHVIEAEAPLEISPNVSQGCHKWLELHRYPDVQSCVDSLRARGFALWAAALGRESVSLTDIDFGRPTALVLGNERLGLSEELIRACDGIYTIPMSGFVESFNISVAAAISMFYATLPATVHGGGAARGLAPEDSDALRHRWLGLSVKQRGRIRRALAQMGESPSTGVFSAQEQE